MTCDIYSCFLTFTAKIRFRQRLQLRCIHLDARCECKRCAHSSHNVARWLVRRPIILVLSWLPAPVSAPTEMAASLSPPLYPLRRLPLEGRPQYDALLVGQPVLGNAVVVGAAYRGFVGNVKTYGAFVRVPPGIDGLFARGPPGINGLLHVCSMRDGDLFHIDPSTRYTKGDEVVVVALGLRQGQLAWGLPQKGKWGVPDVPESSAALETQRHQDFARKRRQQVEVKGERRAEHKLVRDAEVERERDAEWERERHAERERERHAERERERHVELKRERYTKRERERPAEPERELRAEREGERQVKRERERQDERERERHAKLDRQRRTNCERERQVERQRQRQAERESERQAAEGAFERHTEMDRLRGEEEEWQRLPPGQEVAGVLHKDVDRKLQDEKPLQDLRHVWDCEVLERERGGHGDRGRDHWRGERDGERS